MHYSQTEKYEIIQHAEQSDLGVNRTLRELKVNKTTFLIRPIMMESSTIS